LEQAGEAYEWLAPEEAAERFPAISFDGLLEVLYQPDAGVCLADRTVAALLRLAGQNGVDIRDQTKVEGIDLAGDGVRVRTAAGDISAGLAVVTAGAWAAGLLAGVGVSVPLVPILQRVAYFSAADGSPPDLPTLIDWTGPGELSSYALPPAGVAPGMKVGQHVGGVPVEPGEGPFDVDQDLVGMLADYVRRRFPGLAPEPVHAETCLYAMTPDEDFIIDRIGPVVVGSPCSGHGFKFAPLIGDLLADLAMGRHPDIPGARFALGRPALSP
jgi:sarcosine oxidase